MELPLSISIADEELACSDLFEVSEDVERRITEKSRPQERDRITYGIKKMFGEILLLIVVNSRSFATAIANQMSIIFSTPYYLFRVRYCDIKLKLVLFDFESIQ